MSDDLINRSELIKALEKYCGNQPYLVSENIWEIIKNIPNSYDLDKVIEDLIDWKRDAEKWAAKYDEMGDTENMDIQDMAARCYENAIEIIKKGGIS